MSEAPRARALAAFAALWIAAVPGFAARAIASPPAGPDTLSASIFSGTSVHFSPDSAARFLEAGESVRDSGRVIVKRVNFPEIQGPYRIRAELTAHSLYKDDRTPFDRYDRAGNVRLAVDGMPDLEIARFMTSYGGRTDYEFDVSDLAPLLRGAHTVKAYIDTWLSPAWKLDFSLRYVRDTVYDAPSWAAPVYYSESFNRQNMPGGVDVSVDVPPGLARVVMRYVSTGHCTDGRDEDEFISKANVISVDGVVVARLHPWRDDCRRYRDRNPYCARWADGSWSSDYSRSGWCPGAEVVPAEIDLTDHLKPGHHTVRFVVEDMRPRDPQGNFGYWRISSCLVGWDHSPRLWRNP